jgi:hypothetical protein
MAPSTIDPKEHRLHTILADCRDRVAALNLSLTPDLLVLAPYYKTLVKDFDAATAEFEIALTTLREYQKSKPV